MVDIAGKHSVFPEFAQMQRQYNSQFLSFCQVYDHLNYGRLPPPPKHGNKLNNSGLGTQLAMITLLNMTALKWKVLTQLILTHCHVTSHSSLRLVHKIQMHCSLMHVVRMNK